MSLETFNKLIVKQSNIIKNSMKNLKDLNMNKKKQLMKKIS